MKITHFSNSFINVTSQGTSLVCDPWSGKANGGGWQSFPEFTANSLRQHLAGVQYVYLSHLHDDHFHPDTLRACGLLDREFIIKRFKAPVMRECLRRMGAERIHELEPFECRCFGPFELSIIPQMSSTSSGLEDDVNYDLDTSIAIKADQRVFFNQVDNPLSFEDLKVVQRHVLEKLGRIDVACVMSGAASEYPHLFMGIDISTEKQRIVERSLVDLVAWLDLLKPRYFFPAGGTYLIPGWMSAYNDGIAQPTFEQIAQALVKASLPLQAIRLEGGGFIDLDNDGAVRSGIAVEPIDKVLRATIARHLEDSYDYEDIPLPESDALSWALEAARENWRKKVASAGLRLKQSLVFKIHPQLRPLVQGQEAFGVKTFELWRAQGSDSDELVIHIDRRAIMGCLTRRLIWNGMLGALCLYERRPNVHHPAVVFSLNFLTLSDEQRDQLVWKTHS
jgi:UDP-MurNAc hydroxylase